MKKLIFVLIISLVGSCGKKEDDELVSDSDSCSFDVEYNYALSKNSTTDFIASDVPVTFTISNSNCDDLDNGSYEVSDPVLFVARIEDTIIFGNQSTSGTKSMIDLSILNGALEQKTYTSCANGEEVKETVVSSTLGTDSMTFAMNVKIKDNNCSDLNIRYETTDIAGSWETSCQSGVQVIRAFYKSAAIEMTNYYSGGSCSGSKFMYVERNGPYLYSNNQLDISYQNFYIKILNSSFVSDFNSNSICGKTNWSSGSDIDVSGLNCDLTSVGHSVSYSFPSTYEREYDIVSIGSTTLTFGDTASGDKSSEAQRPSSYDSQNYSINSSYTIIPNWLL